MTPKFKHDEDEFLGHFFGHDVYLYDAGHAVLIIARYGDAPADWVSCPLLVVRASIEGGHQICGDGWQIPYHDYIFSTHCISATKAMILGLVIKATQ